MSVTPDSWLHIMSSGRNASPWTEVWSARVFGLDISNNPNEAWSDATSNRGAAKYSFKTLTKNTFIGPSSGTGVKRKCTPEMIEEAISSVVAYVFTDVTQLPEISLVYVPASIIMKWWKEGSLGKNGRPSHKKFYALLGARETQWVNFITGEDIAIEERNM